MISLFQNLTLGLIAFFAATPIQILPPAVMAENTALEIPTVELSTTTQNTTAIYKLSLEAGLSTTSAIRLQTIAQCESLTKQFNDDGTLYLGEVNSADVGIFQINTDYSPQKVVKEKLNLDIDTLEGNIKYAIVLFKKNGSQPWYLSEHCWSKVILR